jgi:catechol 2,3-dioxygenase
VVTGLCCTIDPTNTIQGVDVEKVVAPDIGIGHVHLKVTDIERSVRFYEDVLGMDVVARYGEEAAFMSYDGYHHHLGLNTWHSKGMDPAPVKAAGLYHFALIYPSRKDLANTVKRVLEAGWGIDGSSDHGANVSVYMHDPDQNGIEIYYDRPPEEWPRDPDGNLKLLLEPLDVEALLREAD